MRTPREFLLARHQAAGSPLDAIRRSVVAELINRNLRPRSQAEALVTWFLGCSGKAWLELIWTCRGIWSGLTVVWIVLLIINFSLRDDMSSVTGKTVRSSEVIMSLQTQQRWMNELLADRLAPPEADRPRKMVPQPRTEISGSVCV